MAGKFQMRSRKWDIAVVLGSIVLAIVGFGGLFLLQAAVSPGTSTLLFIVAIGIVTLVFFAGPGIVYSARKRIAPVKKSLPGGTMAWIRSHLYLPVLAVAAAYVHASVAPFRGELTSGKATFVLAVLVVISGWARHHMIGVQKEALNVDVAISKMAAGEPREFRALVSDYLEDRRTRDEVAQAAAAMGDQQRATWARIAELSTAVEKHFPRSGGQTARVRQYKLWKALHPPLTVLLFTLLAFHVWDVFGGNEKLFGDEKTQFASSAQCADCHSDVFDEWASSTMAHAQNGTIMEAQLPVTIGRNEELAEELGGDQAEAFESSAKACINCHAQVGARFAESTALLPFGADGSGAEGGVAVSGGDEAVQSDGVGCIVCHTQVQAPTERAGFGQMPIDNGGSADYGTQYGPLFDDPLPVRVHGVGTGDDDLWADPVSSSKLCGACHNVKVDADGDGLGRDADESNADFVNDPDDDGDNILNQNELDNDDGTLDDLVLQTTYDEWQDYVAAYEDELADDESTTVTAPLGCVECHMPLEGDGTQPAVDYAPGLLPKPERTHRSHSFVGVDYDLDPGKYKDRATLERVLEERQALLASAVTVEVTNLGDLGDGLFGANVTMRNNLLGHAFPTGFAFARQFWLEVSAETEDGDEVCLASPADGLGSPCASGVIEDPVEEIRQCDPRSVEEATGIEVADTDLAFAVSFDADECDPWLTNFQKVLTDGDPDDDGTFEEVSYQSFLGDIVKIRTRVATQQRMDPLESVRLRPDANGELQDAREASFPYVFELGDADPDDIVVTARLRFRHLPPYFVRALEAEQEELDRVPDEARIDAEELLENMVVADVVTARSDEGPQLGCEGPQNRPDASIFDCIDDGRQETAHRGSGRGGAAGGTPATIVPAALLRNPIGLWLLAVLALSTAAGLVRHRTRRRASS